MNCLQFQERLQALLDSRQDIADDQAVRQHMAGCPDCEALATAYTAVVRVPLRSADEQPIEGLADRVVAELNSPATHRPAASGPRYVVWLQMAAALAACVLVAVGIYRQEEQAAPSGSSPGSHQVATEHATAPIATPAVDLPGREMFFRTGQGLASFSIGGAPSSASQSPETGATSDGQFFYRTLNQLRRYLPAEGDSGSATQGETGFLEPPTYALVS